jgi:hypothetical protein
VSPFIDHFVKQPLEKTIGFVGFLKASSKQFEKYEAEYTESHCLSAKGNE